MKLFQITLLTVLILSVNLQAEIINVPDDYETIQVAIDASEDGDTIQVEPGEYIENVDIRRKEIVLIGNPDDPSKTVIDGDRQGSVVSISGSGENIKLTGFTIRNGYANDGGGIYLRGYNITIEYLIVVDNEAENGGGMYVMSYEDWEPIIRNVVVENNISGGRTAGILCCSNAVFENVAVINNRCEGDGPGGMSFHRGQQTLRNVQVIGNSTDTYGGGIFMMDCETTLSNVLIAGNSAGGDGGGIRLWRASPILNNVTFVGNISESRNGGGLSVCWESHPVLCNCIFFNNEPEISIGVLGDAAIDISYTNIYGGRDSIITGGEFEINWGDGNIEGDPLFVDFDEGDYHLTVDSPCIDTGNPDNDPDPDGTRADMGAFHFHQKDIAINPSRVHFPAIPWGDLDSIDVDIINVGGTTLHILSIQPALVQAHIYFEPYGRFDPPVALEAGEKFVLRVFNHPDWRAGNQSGAFIRSDDPDEREVFISMIADVMSVNEEIEVPLQFELYPAHPNPFNSTTTIRYALPYPSNVSLEVYNLLGQRVTTIFDGNRQPGVHTTTLTAVDLPSGLYFVRLEALGLVSLRKVMLIK
ncbi:MAG: T9SS type A sorting domain-containing protein [Candidatus Hatepunaea meridiana]|nr:T9SS type A sorting domain-containing protein [Candidatus Hatepunaea meridiana]